MLFPGNLDEMRQPSALTVLPRWRVSLRDTYEARAELMASDARRRFGRTFGPRDYAFTRAGDDAVRVESTSMLHHSVALDMFAPNASAVTSANVLHYLAVPAPPVPVFSGTLPLLVEGYMAAMFGRLVTFEWFWQTRDAALHEAVHDGRAWLIKREITRKRIHEVSRESFRGIVLCSTQVFVTGSISRIC